MLLQRFDRNIRFFGEQGQARLRNARVAVVGIGGLGTHVVQQLAFLGVGVMTLIDSEELDESNRNRYIGSGEDDRIPGTLKTAIGERLIKSIDSSIGVTRVDEDFISERGFSAVLGADHVFGCLDTEGARLVLTQLCAAYGKPYFDLASEIIPGEKTRYGGRICFSRQGEGCLLCLGELDASEAGIDLGGEGATRQRDAIYGVNKGQLGRAGPSVVTINGIVASVGTTEFMLEVTGIRPALRLIKYYGHIGKFTVPSDPPAPDCYVCKGVYGRRDAADVQHYIRDAALRRTQRGTLGIP